MKKILNVKIFKEPTLNVAEDLIGKYIVSSIGDKVVAGMITETEAYIGEDDLACHASKGRTKRTEILYQDAGTMYIYMIYGMYYCLNIVTQEKDFPSAVLIRSIKIDGVDYNNTNGPGKLCKVLKIDKKLNGFKIGKQNGVWIEDRGVKINKKDIIKSPRVSIDYAGHCKDFLWRFSIKV